MQGANSGCTQHLRAAQPKLAAQEAGANTQRGRMLHGATLLHVRARLPRHLRKKSGCGTRSALRRKKGCFSVTTMHASSARSRLLLGRSIELRLWLRGAGALQRERKSRELLN
jgi:hypothetical protein